MKTALEFSIMALMMGFGVLVGHWINTGSFF